jgi:hypothetical protein
VAKNMLGAYHLPKLRETLRQVVYVYVERDPLDVCVSILDARRKYYDDPRTWWSYVPVEYPLLRDRDEWEQVAGQVHYLARFYARAFADVGQDAVVRVTYERLCRDPASVLAAVQERAEDAYGYRIGERQAPPEFPVRTHDDRAADKERFAALLERFRAEDP